MEPQEFRRRLDELRTLITDGVAYYSAWRGLMVEDEESAQALNRYRALFLPARNALLLTALMQFAKVFDRDRRTVSLRNLLVSAQENRATLTPTATPEQLVQITEQLDQNEDLLNRLKRLRDQRIAHHDAIAAGDRAVLHGEMQRLVGAIGGMYNALRQGHDQHHVAFGGLTRDAEWHTSEVVRIMREERDRGIREIAEADALVDSTRQT